MAFRIDSLVVYCPQCDQVVQIIDRQYHAGPSAETTLRLTCLNCGLDSVLSISQMTAEAQAGTTDPVEPSCSQCGSAAISDISCPGCGGTGSDSEAFQCEICDGGRNHQGYQCRNCEATWGESSG